VAWFDDGAPYRPHWLAPLPVAALGVLALLVWLSRRGAVLWGTVSGRGRGLLLVVALAFLFRLPLAVWGACGYTTPDGTLSGIVALHLRNGTGHHVFIPSLPYSGSLKSHLAVALSLLTDLPRAFALSSLVFYALFVGGVYRLALLADAEAAVPAGLYLAFSPAFVTHYSLSNDGNYVEVLAFGTWALVLAIRALREREDQDTLALGAGLLLGLGLWSHLLAIIYVASVLLLFLGGGRRAPLLVLWLALGGALGYAPGILWNAGHGWESLVYVLPGAHTMRSVAAGPGLPGRAWLMVTDQWPILMGYDPGYGPVADLWLLVAALAGIVLVLAGALRALREGNPALRALLVFAAVNLVVATVSLPHVPQNPRYILFLMTPVPILLAHLLKGRARPVLALLVATGALASLGQAPEKIQEDERWRGFVSDLEGASVHACYSDFYIATKIVFLSGERVVCCSKLGPTFTEYFDYRGRVEGAAEAALIPVNETAAEKVEKRLSRLGVSWTRRDFMKPTFYPLSRKVDPQELFPEKAFPER
jgi:hypothetical protein